MANEVVRGEVTLLITPERDSRKNNARAVRFLIVSAVL